MRNAIAPRATLVSLLVALSAGTIGCSKSQSGSRVEYYRQHKEARVAKVQECMERANAAKDLDCISAREAHGLDGVGNLRRLPPMGLVEAEEKAAREREAGQDR